MSTILRESEWICRRCSIGRTSSYLVYYVVARSRVFVLITSTDCSIPRNIFKGCANSHSQTKNRGLSYLVVEKILAPHEQLREDWPVDGSTGYDFANLVLGLLIDPAGEESVTHIYQEFCGETRTFAQIVRDSKIRIMENEMASELHELARDAARIARQNPITADFTLNILRRVLQEVVACFPVYRTYVDASGTPSAEDRRYLEMAVAQARSIAAEIDPSVFDFVANLLSGDLVARPRSGFSRHSALHFAMKLQQYSGPVMAKGFEDTAFYRYNRFVALNEVGGRPDRFGVSLEAFHTANEHRATRWPRTMLSTSTHDTKRGEDVRARLAVLSEMPEEWARQLQTWRRILRAENMEGFKALDRNDEYLFYQLLSGSWPAELTGSRELDANALTSYLERIKTGRVHSAGTRWRAAVKGLLLAVSPPSSPTTRRLPKCPPSAISGSAAAFGSVPRSVSDWCWIARRSPWSAAFPPPPPPRVAPLCSAASLVLRSVPTPAARTRPPFGFAPSLTGLSDSQARRRSRACCFSTCTGSSTTPRPAQARDVSPAADVAFPPMRTGSARGSPVFGAQSPGPPMPLSTLRRTPRDVPRKTQGQNRVAAPFL